LAQNEYSAKMRFHQVQSRYRNPYSIITPKKKRDPRRVPEIRKDILTVYFHLAKVFADALVLALVVDFFEAIGDQLGHHLRKSCVSYSGQIKHRREMDGWRI